MLQPVAGDQGDDLAGCDDLAAAIRGFDYKVDTGFPMPLVDAYVPLIVTGAYCDVEGIVLHSTIRKAHIKQERPARPLLVEFLRIKWGDRPVTVQPGRVLRQDMYACLAVELRKRLDTGQARDLAAITAVVRQPCDETALYVDLALGRVIILLDLVDFLQSVDQLFPAEV